MGASCNLPETDGVKNNGRKDTLWRGLSTIFEGDDYKLDKSESEPPDP